MGLLAWWICLFGHASSARVEIPLRHWVDARALVLDTLMYRNDSGEAYSISKCKYYIGRIQLHAATGKDYLGSDFYLIDLESEPNPVLRLAEVPPGTYTGMSFILGVDSTGQGRGVQSGALDPVHGMFWTWNTGYIFFKLEGTAPAAPSPGHFFEYHIGGYKKPANCLRSISLKFPAPLELKGGNTSVIPVHVNLAEALRTPHSILFSAHPGITDFHFSEWVADNYQDMFSLD